MKSTTPQATNVFLPAATRADFLKNVCDTPSMTEARMTSATPTSASAMRVVRAPADEPHPGEDQQDAGYLDGIELLVEPDDREAEHRDVAERGDGLRVGEIRQLEHSQPVD